MPSFYSLMWMCLVLAVPHGEASVLAEEGLLKEDTIANLLKDADEELIPKKPQIQFNAHFTANPDEGCYLVPEHDECLQNCRYNTSAKTFIVIHGWTMSGLFEGWLYKLVGALRLREPYANIIVVDWMSLADQLYPDAVNHTKLVGMETAILIDWLQEKGNMSLQNVHLIGYSLGAHVAGFAGNYITGTLGRITGLDPAGPMFEDVEAHKRLSPDDAEFVDVLHTYTREALGVSIGIKMPIGHIDIYPNGGDCQPGCSLSDVIGAIAYGNIGEAVKCEHERSVHLFVDSLINKDQESFAFQCTNSSRFKKGICLSCRKNRCNAIGYNAKKSTSKRNIKMYLKTRAQMPYKVFHYQLKMHIFNYMNEQETSEPTFSVILVGTANDSVPLSLNVPEKIGYNFTNTFLVYSEHEVGDLLTIKLKWDGTKQSWFSFWSSSFWYGSKGSEKELHVRRIRVKSGETQQKFTFCLKDITESRIVPGGELVFEKCRDGWEVKSKKRVSL
ncbi:endothelial lipase [Hyla sarda]|uniref:endothelial lipase n=1 Tax=Hyla sarda TaxID=327740 RepID=UPI0024C30E64|nr:endothelial lipase [Hyla sarda]